METLLRDLRSYLPPPASPFFLLFCLHNLYFNDLPFLESICGVTKSEMKRGPRASGNLESCPCLISKDIEHLLVPRSVRASTEQPAFGMCSVVSHPSRLILIGTSSHQSPPKCNYSLHSPLFGCFFFFFSVHSMYLCPGVKFTAAILKLLLLESIFLYNFRI